MTPAATNDCERELIHVPGSIQPHGALLALTDDGRVVCASDNASDLIGAAAALGTQLSAQPQFAKLHERLTRWRDEGEPSLLCTMRLETGGWANVAAHRSDGLTLLELEPLPETPEAAEGVYGQLRSFLEAVPTQEAEGLTQRAADAVRSLTGFERVLIYRFDSDWHGAVIAEANGGRLPAYIDLRFPASDIPAQARELYRANRVRLIPDAYYKPSPIRPEINPLTGRPLDLTFSVLRSVSPVHVEYMRNMGTLASMSVSIVVEGKLWGLIACHHPEPHRTTLQARTACDLLAQVLALQLASREREAVARRRLELKAVEGELLVAMGESGGFAKALRENESSWLGLAGATGAALTNNNTVTRGGDAPDAAAILAMVAWLNDNAREDPLASDALARDYPELAQLAPSAAGLLAVPVSDSQGSWLLWFRPEVVRTVTWAGDPTKPINTGGERLHPRHSFDAWKEEVRGRSTPWGAAELASVKDFRDGVVQIVLRRAEERAALTSELERSNKELEAFSYSISHDLRAPFRHIVGYAELLSEKEADLDSRSRHYVTSIKEAALNAGRLVDDLLNFSHLNRGSLHMSRLDMDKLVAEARKTLTPAMQDRRIEWRVSRLPQSWGDPSLIRQVWVNLLDNAVKYSRPRETAVITVDGEIDGDRAVYHVQDNGVGFDPDYASKLFGVFQRLHRAEEFEGTGIGLAIVKRIVDRHGGEISASSVVGDGSVFRFSLPVQQGFGGAENA